MWNTIIILTFIFYNCLFDKIMIQILQSFINREPAASKLSDHFLNDYPYEKYFFPTLSIYHLFKFTFMTRSPSAIILCF